MVDREDGTRSMIMSDDEVVYDNCRKFTCTQQSNDRSYEQMPSYGWVESPAL